MADTIFTGFLVVALALIPVGIALMVLSRKRPEKHSFLFDIGLSLLIAGLLAASVCALVIFLVVYTFAPLVKGWILIV